MANKFYIQGVGDDFLINKRGRNFYVSQVGPQHILLDYIESTGTQWINTDYYPNPNTAVEVDYYPNPSTVFTNIFGVQDSASSNRFYGLISSVNYKLQINTSAGSNTYYGLDGNGNLMKTNVSYTGSQIRIALKVDNFNKLIRTIEVDNGKTVNYDMNQFSELGSPDCNYPLVIFNRSTAGVVTTTNGYKGRIYSFKIWESDKLVRYLVPVLDKNLTPCMYDYVTNKYYYNQGTGQFKGYLDGGSQVVSSLTASGTQWIDTSITPLIGDEIELRNVQCVKKSSGMQAVFSAGTGNYQVIILVADGTYSDRASFYKYFASGGAKNINPPNYLNNPTNIKITGDGSVYYNDNFIIQSPPEGAVNTTLRLFYRANDSQPMTGKIGAVSIKRNGEFILNLIPVIKPDSTACMYDLITKQYFVNQGTGTFIGG